MTVHCYLRVSSKSQAASGCGIDMQRVQCENYFNLNMSDNDIVYYIDNGLSGSLDIYKRPELSKAICALEKGDKLLSYDSSRLSRSAFVWLTVEKAVKDAGCEIVLSNGMNGDTIEMKMIRGIMSQLNEFNRLKSNERVKLGLKIKRERDGQIQGSPRYGYVISKCRTKLLNVESEQIVLKIVDDMMSDGEKLKNIVAYLNDSGYSNRSGRQWSYHNLYMILKKRR